MYHYNQLNVLGIYYASMRILIKMNVDTRNLKKNNNNIRDKDFTNCDP